MKYLKLLLALAFVVSAQTFSSVPGITLTGDPGDPMVQNHSGKTLLWVRMNQSRPGGTPSSGGAWFINHPGEPYGLSDNASAKAWRHPMRVKIAWATIVAAIFEDGEFRGEDKAPIRHDTELDFQFMRETWQWAQAGEWDKVQARADTDDMGINPKMTAIRLLKARGDGAAMASMAYLGLLPASTWTAGPLINKIQIPILREIAAWFAPVTVHAQAPCTLPTTCPPISFGAICSDKLAAVVRIAPERWNPMNIGITAPTIYPH